ncbi:MAG: hypothetical protein NZ530_02160 [Thermodesulfobacteriaceae bacterium]|nr:hypothetical protein [Thermodesulfobacteriaceae bacterium]MDW8135854.1 hypothetical protein [Thermodesulfobacterium sp.]
MKIKRFRGKNITEALSKVKEEFGEEAVILNSERITEDKETYYEITAAIEEKEINLSEREKREGEYSFQEDLKKELMEIKTLLKKALNLNQPENYEYLKWIERGIPPFIAKEVIEEKISWSEYVFKKLKEKGVVPHSKVQIYIGEAGVGKTSNIFKIATWYKSQRKAKVLIISLDNYKIEAIFQVKRIAELLEFDFKIVDLDEFPPILKLGTNYDYILVDAPALGRGILIEELEELYYKMPFLRFQWVVKATEHYFWGLKTWEKIKKLPVEGILLTFADKIVLSYPILWLLDSQVPPINFISTGERLPEDLIRAENSYLLKFFLRGLEET